MAYARTEIKSGEIKVFEEHMFSSDWKTRYARLYNDSTLAWFKDSTAGSKQKGSILLRTLIPYFVVGQYTQRIPSKKPDLNSRELNQVFAVATGPGSSAKAYWFLLDTDADLNGWVSAISSTFPPPPQQVQQPQQPPPMPGAPPPYPQQQPTMYPQVQPSPVYAQQQPRPVYVQQQPVYVQQQQPQTVYVQQPAAPQRSGFGGMGGLGTGLAIGALGGLALGHHHHHDHFGGHHFGGHGFGGHHSDTFIENDTTIINNYDGGSSSSFMNNSSSFGGDTGGGGFSGSTFGGDTGGFGGSSFGGDAGGDFGGGSFGGDTDFGGGDFGGDTGDFGGFD